MISLEFFKVVRESNLIRGHNLLFENINDAMTNRT